MANTNTTTTHKDVYAQAFKEHGKEVINIPFSKLAERYGAEHFPPSFSALVMSHCDDDVRCQWEKKGYPALADYQALKDEFSQAALWMISESWYGCKKSQLDTAEKIQY